MKKEQKRVLSGILIIFILAGIAVFVVLATGIFFCRFADSAPMGVYEL